jgi:hypothetical protein
MLKYKLTNKLLHITLVHMSILHDAEKKFIIYTEQPEKPVIPLVLRPFVFLVLLDFWKSKKTVSVLDKCIKILCLRLQPKLEVTLIDF